MDHYGAISISKVGKRLGVSVRTARKIVASGDLRAHRIRRQWRVFEEDLREYLAKQANRQPPVNGGEVV